MQYNILKRHCSFSATMRKVLQPCRIYNMVYGVFYQYHRGWTNRGRAVSSEDANRCDNICFTIKTLDHPVYNEIWPLSYVLYRFEFDTFYYVLYYNIMLFTIIYWELIFTWLLRIFPLNFALTVLLSLTTRHLYYIRITFTVPTIL